MIIIHLLLPFDLLFAESNTKQYNLKLNFPKVFQLRGRLLFNFCLKRNCYRLKFHKRMQDLVLWIALMSKKTTHTEF